MMAAVLRLTGLLLALAAVSANDGGRRLLIRPMPGTGASLTCRNTMLGPWMYTDDKGTLCKADALDHRTGCCRSGEKHACSTCNARDSCCEVYEACVSCCLAPANGAKQRLPEVTRVPGKKSSGTWGDEFELCAAVCRTHSRSTAHENAYISPRHHCFSRLGKPLLSPPLPPKALDGVTVSMGAPGFSCDSTCERHGQRCSAAHLPLLDTCDRLRESVACEAGCVEEPLKGIMPLYVSDDAPKADRPALCVVSTLGGRAAVNAAAPGRRRRRRRAVAEDGSSSGSGGGAHSCSANQQHMRRLCPCVTGTPGQQQGEVGGSGAPTGAAASVVDPGVTSEVAPTDMRR